MKIGGFQKASLLDYPGEISVIIWTVGCNFNCPFCYNIDLVKENADIISEDEILSFLKKRKGLVDGLVISGGEPLMHKDLDVFIKKVKKIGYKIKIDTNGCYPGTLEKFLDEGLVDYVAMDVKAPKKKYDGLSGVKTSISKVNKSIKIIQEKASNYEFKTTFVPDLLTKEDIVEIAKWLKGSRLYYLQQFKNDIPVISSKLSKKQSYSSDYLKETLNEIKPYFDECYIRGD